MRNTFTLLAGAAIALSLVGGAVAKDMGGPYAMNDKLHRCTDVKGNMVASAKCATPAPAAGAMASSMASGAKPKKCTKGKPCGNSCIAMSDVCHIPAK